MNCQLFEELITDLARDQMMEASRRERGLAHVAECARCAARLRDERSLSASLRALAEGDKALAAPDRVEAALLAAFRARAAASTETPARGWRKSRWAMVAVTVSLLVLALTVPRLIPSSASNRESQPNGSPALTISSSPAGTELSVPTVSPSEQRRMAARDEMLKPRLARPRSRFNRFEKAIESEEVLDFYPAREIATDFIPTVYGGLEWPLDSGQLLRIQMPRSALASFGLPINYERADQPIKAEVLVGTDGLARAIRFVR
jgi:hypothetical protein